MDDFELFARSRHKLLSGCYRGEDAVLKLGQNADQRGDLRRELEVYERLRDLQGVAIPRLLDAGYLDFLPSVFGMLLSREGESPVDDNDHSEEQAALVKLLESRGVYHNDVKSDNFVWSRDGKRSNTDSRLWARNGLRAMPCDLIVLPSKLFLRQLMR